MRGIGESRPFFIHMNVVVNRKTLIDALVVGGSLAGRNKSIPILDCAKLAFSGKHLMISSMDGESAIVKRISIEEEASGVFCVSAMDLLKALRSIKEDEIALDFTDKVIEIIYSRGSIELPLWTVDSFPSIPKAEVTTTAVLPADTLRQWVGIAKDFVSTDDLRPVLTGMFLYIDGAELGVCATNAHKLFTDSITYENPTNIAVKVIIASKLFPALYSLLDGATTVHIAIDDRNISFTAGDAKISCRLIEGIYAAFKQILPTVKNHSAAVSRKDLLDAVGRVSLCSNTTTSLIKMTLAGDTLTVRGEDMDFAKLAEETIYARHDGPDVALGLKSDYLQTLLSVFNTESVLLELEDERHPLVVKDALHPNMVLLMMPMMIN